MRPTFRINDDFTNLGLGSYTTYSVRPSPSNQKHYESSSNFYKNETSKNSSYGPRHRNEVPRYVPQSERGAEFPLERRNSKAREFSSSPKAQGFSSTQAGFYNLDKGKEEKKNIVEFGKTGTTFGQSSSYRSSSTNPLSKSVFIKDPMREGSNILTRRKPEINLSKQIESGQDGRPSPHNNDIRDRYGEQNQKKGLVTYYHLDEFINKYKKLNGDQNYRISAEKNEASSQQKTSNRTIPNVSTQQPSTFMKTNSNADTNNSQPTPSFRKFNDYFENQTNNNENESRYQSLMSKIPTFEYKRYEFKDINNQPVLTRNESYLKRTLEQNLDASFENKDVEERRSSIGGEKNLKESYLQRDKEEESLDNFVTRVGRSSVLSVFSKTENRSDSKDREDRTENTDFSFLDEAEVSRTTQSKDSPFKSSYQAINREPRFFKTDEKAPKETENNYEHAKWYGKSTGASTSRNEESTDSSQDEEVDLRSTFEYYNSNLQKHLANFDERNSLSQLYKEHFLQTFQSMKFSKFMNAPDSKTLSDKRVFLPQKEFYKNKKTLIFDLDETLIHCNESRTAPSDVKLPIKLAQVGVTEAGINIRPYAIECLRELSKEFEIIVFTASHKAYANVVLDYLDPKRQYIQHRLYRESCYYTNQGVYVKDLRILGNRNLKDIVLIDNAAYSFGFQVDNGVPIIPFYDNKNDQELRYLASYLKKLKNVKDVREINRKMFKLYQYPMYRSPEEVMHNLILKN